MRARNASLLLLACAGALAAALVVRGARRAAPEERADVARPDQESARPSPAAPAALAGDAPAPDARASVEEERAGEPALRGRLVDADGAPVAGADVFALRAGRLAERVLPPQELLRRAPDAGLRARSDADGAFVLPLGALAASPELRLAVRAAGFAPLERSLDARARALGTLALARGVVLEGVVRDRAGQPVAGAALRALDPVNRSGLPAAAEGGELLAESDARGAFRAEGLASGPWRMLVRADDHPDLVCEGRTSAPGERVRDLVLVLADGVAIEGRVTGDPQVLEGALVRAIPLAAPDAPPGGGAPAYRGPASTEDALPAAREARVGAQGAFAVRGLEPGRRYRLAVWRAGAHAAARPDSAWVEAGAGERGVGLALRGETALAFQAVDAASGLPLPVLEARAGCTLLVPLAGDDGRPRHDFPEGRVLFPLLFDCGARPVTLRVAAPGHETLVVDELAPAAGTTLALGVLALEPLPEISVLVLADASGAPVEGAEVELRPARAPAPPEEDPWRVARTDAGGRARVHGRPEATLAVRHPGFLPAEEPAPGSALGERVVRLRAPGRALVEVVDEHGAPIVSAWVRHQPEASAVAEAAPRWDGARTDRAGVARFEALARGVHHFEIRWESAAGPDTVVAGALEVVEGGEHALRLVVPARG